MFREIWNFVVNFWPHLVQGTKDFLHFLIVISFPLSVFFIIAIIYCVEQLKVIKKRDAEKHDLKIEPAFEEVKAENVHNLAEQWQKVTDLLNSQNQNDWKQAILEADVIMDEILTGLGYQGESVGEKLKRIQPGELKNIQNAWDAHKIRNQIAHEGSAFQLTHHEANRVIQMYRSVFEEFYYI